MRTVSREAAPAPIHKLNGDLLYNILNILIPWNPVTFPRDDENIPLDVIRRISHVCHEWRQISLQLPVIWGRCIQLELMQQQDDSWRNLVIQRSGQHSLLFVTGSKTTPISAEGVLARFLVQLLHESWERIRVLDVLVDPSIMQDPRVRKALDRPSTRLHTLGLFTKSTNRLPYRDQPTFTLSLENVPNLTQLSLSLPHWWSSFPLDIHQSPPITTNLQKLVLLKPGLVLKDIDLLTACAQMPMLEYLHIQIDELVLTTPPQVGSLCRPNMPHLDSISVAAASLDIYPAFLDRIVPRAGCALHICHKIEHKYSARTETNIVTMDAMQRVIKHYAASYFERHEGESHFSHYVDIVMVTGLSFEFCFDSIEHCFMVHLPTTRNIDPGFLQQLLDTLSSLDFPSSVEVLQLCVPARYIRYTGLTDHPPGLQIIRGIPSISTLRTTLHTISFLGDIAMNENPFPRLTKIAFVGIEYYSNAVGEAIIPFLEHRHNTAPIKILDLSKCHVELLGDLRSLDKLSGLQVVWRSKERKRVEGYVCGTGDGERLLFQRFADQGIHISDGTHTQAQG